MFLQSLEVTIIGMSTVFFVLAILALILKVEGYLVTRVRSGPEKIKEEEKEERIRRQIEEEVEDKKVAAAISAAIYAYLEDEKEDS